MRLCIPFSRSPVFRFLHTTFGNFSHMHTPAPAPFSYPTRKLISPIITDKPLDALNPLISSLLSLYADVSFCILLRIKPSPLVSRVLMFSFSKKTAMFSPFSSLVYFSQSTVFLENRLIDLVRIMPIFPSRQSCIIRLNDSRLAVFVALIPSSSYTSTSSHSGLLLM